MAGGDDDMLRLIAIVDHQRRELDRIRATAASGSIVAMARGALMERLGLSSAEAAGQLAELSSATGTCTMTTESTSVMTCSPLPKPRRITTSLPRTSASSATGWKLTPRADSRS